jgi:hypothetical protein
MAKPLVSDALWKHSKPLIPTPNPHAFAFRDAKAAIRERS